MVRWVLLVVSLMVTNYLSAFNIPLEVIPLSDGVASRVIRFCPTREENGSLQSSLMQHLKVLFHLEVFIESGTYLGHTSENAAKIFPKVHTVELSHQFYRMARRNLHKYRNVNIYEGDSAEVFAQILPKITERALFYLDGHFHGQESGHSSKNTPIMEELAAIEASGKIDSVILIDDIRLFQSSCFPEKIRGTCLEGYPELDELVEALLRINPTYQICFLTDALLAFPAAPDVRVSEVVRACAWHKLSPFSSLISEVELEKADVTIASASGEERMNLQGYFLVFGAFELEQGYRSYATLWYALLLQHDGRTLDALQLFNKAAANSLPGWRVQHFAP